MHLVAAVWLAAIIVRQASNNDDVPEWVNNSTGCRMASLPPHTAVPRLQSPAATVAAFALLAVAVAVPSVSGLAAVTTAMTAFEFGANVEGTRALSEACALALAAAAPITRWGNGESKARLAGGLVCAATVLVVWMSLTGRDLTVVAVAALLPAVHLAVQQTRFFPSKAPVSVLLLMAALVSGTVHTRDVGICDNDTGAAYRRDWSFAFAFLYSASALATLVSDFPTPLAAKALLLPAAATTAMGVLGAKNGWGVAAVLTAVLLIFGLVADAAPRSAPAGEQSPARAFVQQVVWF